MRRRLVVAIVVLVLLVFTLVNAVRAQEPRTTLSATITAEGGWYRYYMYDWVLLTNQFQGISPVVVQQGQTVDMQYLIRADRDISLIRSSYPVWGEVCVTNTGSNLTEGLSMTLIVKDTFDVTVMSVPWNLSEHPVLFNGEQYCYSVEVLLNIPGDYVFAVEVYAGNAAVVHAQVPLTFPTTPQLMGWDALASISV